MSQNDPATFTLNDVRQLVCFISYRPPAYGKQKTAGYFFFFEILRPKKSTSVTSYPTDPKKIVEESNGHMANRKKLIEFYHLNTFGWFCF